MCRRRRWEVVGAINMQGHALTGLPAPSGATDAARKGYVDTEIAGEDRRVWDLTGRDRRGQGLGREEHYECRSISCAKVSPNLILKPAPEGLCTLLTLSLSGGSGTSATKTFHRIEGTGRVKIDISTSTVDTSWNVTNVYNLYKNGTIVWTVTKSSGQSYTMPAVSESIELDVTSGDAFYLGMSLNARPVTFTATFRAAVSLALLDGITT